MSTSTQSTPSTISSMGPQSSPSLSPPGNALNAFAQKLNNSAALCIEVGQYDRAIGSLQRALRLSEKQMGQMKNSPSQHSMSTCTLDGCIAFSDANSLFSGANGNRPTASVSSVMEASCPSPSNVVRHENNKRRRIEITRKDTDLDSDDMVSTTVHKETSINDNNYYVFHRPIRVPRQGEEMGSVLFLIILFNLALAHHLKATAMSTVRHPSPSHSKGLAKAIDKSLMLYQLVVKYWSKLQQRMEENTKSVGSKTNSYSSIWFRMILYNNLGQIYYWTEKPTKERECLTDLLSTVMLATDQSIQHGKRNIPNGFQRDMEGFLSNASALTLHERCAEAA